MKSFADKLTFTNHACQIWLKMKFCTFEKADNPSFYIRVTMKRATFKLFSVYILAGNSNVVKIVRESLTFEKNSPLGSIKNFIHKKNSMIYSLCIDT